MSFLGDILNVGLGLVGLGQSGKAQKSANKQNDAASNLYNQQANQAKSAQDLFNVLIPSLLKQAGYNYTPGTPATPGVQQPGLTFATPHGSVTTPGRVTGGTPGTPGAVTEMSPADLLHSPYYQTAYGAFAGPLEQYRKAQLASLHTGQLNGVHQKGFSEDLLNRNIAGQEANFNRQYLMGERDRQDQMRQYLFGLLNGQMGGGIPAAQGLQGMAATNAATAQQGRTESLNALIPALGEIIYQATKRQKSTTPSKLPGMTGRTDPLAGLPGIDSTMPYWGA